MCLKTDVENTTMMLFMKLYFNFRGERKCYTRMRIESASATSANLTPLVRMWISTSDSAESIEVLSDFVRS